MSEMKIWEVPDSLRDEMEYQLDIMRDLKKKYGFPDDVIEFYSIKFLGLLYRMITSHPFSTTELLTARLVLESMHDYFTELDYKICELENYGGESGAGELKH